MLRRPQVMLRLWHSEGESVSRELAPGHWHLRIGKLRTMDDRVASNTAGFIERYLELAGAHDISVAYEGKPEAEGIVWEFTVRFVQPAETEAA